MRRQQTMLLADLLPEVLRMNHMAEPLLGVRVREAWEQVFPASFKQYLTSLDVDNHVVTVHITSAALRHELYLNKAELIEQLNRLTQANAVVDIKILS